MVEFILKGLNAKNIYFRKPTNEMPKKTKKIEKMEKVNSISFSDVFKNPIKYWVCMEDLNNTPLPHFTNKKCWHHRNNINGTPIGAPYQYIKPVGTELQKLKDYFDNHNFKFDPSDCGIFKTEGVFCSFPCAKTYILEQLRLKRVEFKNALTLLTLMYCKIYGTFPKNIPSAPSWKMHEDAYGPLDEEKYKSSFGEYEYVELPSGSRPLMFSSGNIFEENKLI